LLLSGTPVTDLTPLTSLKHLEWLSLRDTAITEDDLAMLQQALPNCEIDSNVRSQSD